MAISSTTTPAWEVRWPRWLAGLLDRSRSNVEHGALATGPIERPGAMAVGDRGATGIVPDDEPGHGAALADLRATVRTECAQISNSGEKLCVTLEQVMMEACTVSVSVSETVDFLDRTKQAGQALLATSREMQELSGDANRRIDAAAECAEEGGRSVEALAQAFARIGQFLAGIDRISKQTNLLALNARIEAQRAGERGAGFAVIAQEVKVLSSETGQLSKNIEMQLAELVDATHRTQSTFVAISDAVLRARTGLEALTGRQADVSHTIADEAQQTEAAATMMQGVAATISSMQDAITQTGEAYGLLTRSLDSLVRSAEHGVGTGSAPEPDDATNRRSA